MRVIPACSLCCQVSVRTSPPCEYLFDLALKSSNELGSVSLERYRKEFDFNTDLRSVRINAI